MSGLITKRTGNFAETTVDGETVIMVLDSAEFFSLNSTAGSIWRAIDGQRSRQQVMATIAQEFDVEMAEIAAEVDALISQMHDAGLIETA